MFKFVSIVPAEAAENPTFSQGFFERGPSFTCGSDPAVALHPRTK
jgi:hypothetical protein